MIDRIDLYIETVKWLYIPRIINEFSLMIYGFNWKKNFD